MSTRVKDVKINGYGQAILDADDLVELLLRNRSIDYFNVDDTDRDIRLFLEKQSDILDSTTVLLTKSNEDLSFDEYHAAASNTWTFPKGYQELDVKAWLLLKCKTDIERTRVLSEYDLFEEKDMIMILRLFVYLVDYMRQNKFIWGVGRGSAVSSYILYLIGIHRVDSIKYQLEVSEFLR